MPAMSATPRRVPTETTNPLSWKVNASSCRPLSSASRLRADRLALLQRHLRQRGQHVPAARIHHRGKVAGDVDLRMVQHAEVPVDLDAAVVAGRQPRIGYKLGCFHPTGPDEHATLHQLAVLEPEAFLGRGGDRRVGADLDPKVRKDSAGLVDQLR